jgi:redox-sensitive bicupin YhaK (pirin superfamily)
MEMRPSEQRGHANHGWLDTYHSFSFNRYYDPARMGFSVLRVINEDVIAAGRGFGMHPHQDMEIVTYMLDGQLAHQDSLGNGSVIKAGDVQRMTAGAGIVHAEMNPSPEQDTFLLQIWLLPNQSGLTPSYEDKHIPFESKLNQWRLIASADARDDSLLIHQDVNLWATYLEANRELDFGAKPERSLYLQVARGVVQVNEQLLQQGDALAIENAVNLKMLAQNDAEILVFDLPPAAQYE